MQIIHNFMNKRFILSSFRKQHWVFFFPYYLEYFPRFISWDVDVSGLGQ